MYQCNNDKKKSPYNEKNHRMLILGHYQTYIFNSGVVLAEHKVIKIWKNGMNIIFSTQEVNPCNMSTIINNCKKIFVSNRC